MDAEERWASIRRCTDQLNVENAGSRTQSKYLANVYLPRNTDRH